MSMASGRGWNLGLDAHSLKNLGGRGSLLLSLSFLIRQMGRTRSLQRSQVYAKAAQPSAGACAPSAVPFNTPVAPSGFLILSSQSQACPPQPAPQDRGRKEGIPDGASPQLC